MVEEEECTNATFPKGKSVLDLSEDSESDNTATEDPSNCSDLGYLFYNTQAVFDGEGKVVAK